MTTRVVKGSLWTLTGQVLPLAVSLVAMPFVIRLLGTDGYGVLILIGLIPGYFGFADFGMVIASTKFGSEAYAASEPNREGRVVRTAAVIAFLTSLPIAVAITTLSGWIVTIFNFPEGLKSEGALALKFAAVTFVINFLNGIFNTPQLARLRMDLNTLVASGFRIIGIIATPVVIYLGGGILGAVIVLMIASLLTLVGHVYISGRLLPQLFDISLDAKVIRPLIKFASAVAISAVAGVLLINLEKAVLAKTVSVNALAYYSVAFTLATMTTMFSSSMTQSLIPAFSQLLEPEFADRLNNLFTRALRMNFLMILPLLTVLIALARPTFTIWAGEDFGENSTGTFYILAGGVFLNLMAHIPYSLLMATGRSEVFAKVHWMELFPYLAILAVRTINYGAAGAATAWSLRISADAVIISWLLRRSSSIRFNFWNGRRLPFTIAILLISLPIGVTLIADGYGYFPIIAAAIAVPVYVGIALKLLIDAEEKRWLIDRFSFLRA